MNGERGHPESAVVKVDARRICEQRGGLESVPVLGALGVGEGSALDHVEIVEHKDGWCKAFPRLPVRESDLKTKLRGE